MEIFIWVVAVIFLLSIWSHIHRFVYGKFEKTRKEVAIDLIMCIAFFVWAVVLLIK